MSNLLAYDPTGASVIMHTVAQLASDMLQRPSDHVAHACELLALLAEAKLEGDAGEAVEYADRLRLENEALRDLVRQRLGSDVLDQWQRDYDSSSEGDE